MKSVIVTVPRVDSADLESLGRQLLHEIGELAAVEPGPAVRSPKLAKSSAIDWATLIVSVGAGGGVLRSLIGLLRDWLNRQADAKQLEISIGNDKIILRQASAPEREELISAWIERHSEK